MNTLKTILGLVILFGLFFACKKESNPDGCHASIYKYFKLDSEYRPNIPYNGKDTLNFIDTAGNTLTFIGQGIDSNYITEEKYNSGPACPPDINNYQYFSYDFSNNSNIRFKLSIYEQFQDYGFNVIAFSIKNHTFYTYLSRINNPNFKDYIKQISFNGQTFQDVLKVYENSILDTTNLMYFNKSIGVISFRIDGVDFYSK